MGEFDRGKRSGLRQRVGDLHKLLIYIRSLTVIRIFSTIVEKEMRAKTWRASYRRLSGKGGAAIFAICAQLPIVDG